MKASITLSISIGQVCLSCTKLSADTDGGYESEFVCFIRNGTIKLFVHLFTSSSPI